MMMMMMKVMTMMLMLMLMHLPMKDTLSNGCIHRMLEQPQPSHTGSKLRDHHLLFGVYCGGLRGVRVWPSRRELSLPASTAQDHDPARHLRW